MDVTELAECVKPDGNEVLAEMFFQTWFGVRLSHELALPKTDRDVALRMLRHCGWFSEWHTDRGWYFDCLQFDWKGLGHRLEVSVYDCRQPCRYHVELSFARLVKYRKYGDNLVQLLMGALKSEF